MAKKKQSDEGESAGESAGARIRRKGEKPVWVTFDGERHQLVRMAAAKAGVSMAAFAREATLAEARRVMGGEP